MHIYNIRMLASQHNFWRNGRSRREKHAQKWRIKAPWNANETKRRKVASEQQQRLKKESNGSAKMRLLARNERLFAYDTNSVLFSFSLSFTLLVRVCVWRCVVVTFLWCFAAFLLHFVISSFLVLARSQKCALGKQWNLKTFNIFLCLRN